MSCAPVLALAPIVDDVQPDRARVLEAVAALVEAARTARWSRFADVILDLTGAVAAHVVACDGVFGAGLATGHSVEVLHPAPGVRVALSFVSESHRAATADGIRAVERILLTATFASVASSELRPRSIAATIEALPLSPRMREVAHLVVAGRSDKEIADALGVSHTSARSYVQRMCRMLAVSGRGGLLRLVLGEPGPVSARRPARTARRAAPDGVNPPDASARAGQ